MSNATAAAPLAVVVTSYNQARYLPETLGAVWQQQPAPADLVVVDDGSSDDPEATLARLPRQVRFRRQPNSGVSVARNHGLELTSAPLVAFLDADDVWPGGFVAAALAALRDWPEAAAVVLGYRPVLESGAELPSELPPRDPAPGLLGFRDFYWHNPVVSPSLAVFRRKPLEAVGGFDPEIPLVGDYDLWLRLSLRFPVARVTEPRVRYRVHERNASRLGWAAMVEQEAHMFAKLERETLPLSRSERRRRLARVHHALAYNRLAEGRSSEARREALAALAGQPLRLKNWLFLGASWLPPGLVRERMRARLEAGPPAGA